MNLRLLAITSVLLSMGVAEASSIYGVQDLGTAGGSSASANAVNASGLTAGTRQLSTGAREAYGNGSLLSNSGWESLGAAINNSGQIAGTVIGPGGAMGGVWTDGQFQSIGTLGGADSYALAINNNGQVAGGAETAQGRMHAFVSERGVLKDLGALTANGWSSAYGLNDTGLAVGYATDARGQFHAVSWDPSGGISSLGGLSSGQSYALAVNNQGQIVGGAAVAGGAVHATLYGRSGNVDLGSLGGWLSMAYGINDLGQIVGYSTLRDGSSHGFLYTDGQMFDLNSLLTNTVGWTIVAAYGINDAGQIAGTGIWQGVEHAILLDLKQPSAPIVADAIASSASVAAPEPASLLPAAGAVGLLLWGRRRALRR